MRKIRAGAAAISLLLTLAFVASAQAVPNFTTSNVTAPADGSLLVQNFNTNPDQTFAVSGTTDGTTGDLFDIACYNGDTEFGSYAGPSGTGISLTSADGSFSITNVPEPDFSGDTCHLVVVPHGTTPLLGTIFTGPRVGFSEFDTNRLGDGTAYDYVFDDATTIANSGSNSIDECGPYTGVVDGTSAMNTGPYLIDCGGSFYNESNVFNSGTSPDLTRSEIQIDGQNAYGSYSAEDLFAGSYALEGFPAMTASLDSFDSSNGNAQTTESEPLVRCTPNDNYSPTSTDCTAFASTGVAIKRVTSYSNSGRVVTVIDTFTSADGLAHAIDLWYETDLYGATTAGWELSGQTSFSQRNTGDTGPSPTSAPDTVYGIDTIGGAPSFSNPMGALTFAAPYNSVRFDNTLWSGFTPGETSALFDYQRMIPASGSTTITWSYATGTSLSEVQGYAAAAQAELRALVTITSPANGATATSTPLTVSGTAGGGSGVKSVTVNGVTATVSGGDWSASVPLTQGQNTLTATATTSVGSTATASATVTYAAPATVTPVPVAPMTPVPPPRPSVTSKRFNGNAVLVKLACAASGSNCVGRMTLRYTETVIRHDKKHRVTLVLASERYSIGYGHTATVKAALSRTAKRLLKARGKLLTKGTVTVTQANGHQTTGATFKLTIKQPA
jgi:hypothetical protein